MPYIYETLKRELKINREVGIPCVHFLPLQHLNSLGSELKEKSVSCPVIYAQVMNLNLFCLMCFTRDSKTTPAYPPQQIPFPAAAS